MRDLVGNLVRHRKKLLSALAMIVVGIILWICIANRNILYFFHDNTTKTKLQNSLTAFRTGEISQTTEPLSSANKDKDFPLQSCPEIFSLEDFHDLSTLGLRPDESFVKNKSHFYKQASSQQLSEARRILMQMRSFTGQPQSLKYKIITHDEKDNKPQTIENGCYRYPNNCRQWQKDDYGRASYVTNGKYQIFSLSEDKVLPAISARDLDDDVFEDLFPVRLLMDSDYVALGHRQVTAKEGEKTKSEVIGSWLYDVCVHPDTHEPLEITFYSRTDRNLVIHQITDIQFQEFSIQIDPNSPKRIYRLPVAYTRDFRTSRRGELVRQRIQVEYSEFDQPIPNDMFHLSLDSELKNQD